MLISSGEAQERRSVLEFAAKCVVLSTVISLVSVPVLTLLF